jgi:Tol biopolymer transport system component
VVEFGVTPRWFKDRRRLLFAGRGKLYVADSASRRVREVLSIPPNELEAPSLSGDNRTIVFRMTVTEADIWLATRQ